MEQFIRDQIKAIKEQVGETDKVLLGLSGGVDSAVCAALISKAIPGRLICIFVDHGFMRKDEPREIEETFSKMDLTLVCVDAEKRFLDAVKGVTDPEQKRKIIGKEFIEVFNEEAAKFSDVKYLAQGTIYPDIVESGDGKKGVVKSHHNVGGLPEKIKFDGLVEPLKTLYKDEVRAVGRLLGLPKAIVNRQPFPGPGLAVRCIGELTKERLDILREADAIVREEIGRLRRKPNQYFAVLTDMKSVGVKNDERTYAYTVAIRAVSTVNFMTAKCFPLSQIAIGRISKRITDEVEGINRVVLDVTDKPPATIEWE